MFSFRRALLSISLVMGFILNGFGQLQDKEQSKAMLELAVEMLKASQAQDDIRDILVQAANLDTTNIVANFEAGRLHHSTIKKEQAARYFLRIYRQRPNYRFDLEYYIASSYQFGLAFDKAIDFYNRYKEKYRKQPNYQGKDKIPLPLVDRKIFECNNGKAFVANPKPYAIVNLGPQINSEYDDYAPVLNEKEDEIIFTSRRLDGNLNENVYEDNKPFEDIFISNKVNGKWLRASNIGRAVNIPDHNSDVSLSPDGKTLFTYRSDGAGDFFISELKSDGSWSPAKKLPGAINSPYYESSMSVSSDGNSIYFASDRPGGYGSSDLYVATKDNRGNWNKVKNLGSTINTEESEDSPFIDYSGQKLYFSSFGHNGMGGFDIYQSTLVNANKNEWSEPENMGYPINTPDNDIYFTGTPDGKGGFYASVREDGLGYLDVYAIVPKDLAKAPTTVLPLKFVVKVIDAKTNTPLEAAVELLSISDSKPVTTSSQIKGTYTFTITTKDPKIYRMSVSHEGYFPQVEEVTLQSADMVEKIVNRTVGMAKSDKAPVIIPLKYVVQVVDSKTKTPLSAALVKLEGVPDKVSINSLSKGSGNFEFSIISTAAKGYKLSVELNGYTAQSESINLEGAGTTERTVSKIVSLEQKKEPVTAPLLYVVKVVNSKNNLPIEAKVFLESISDKISIPGRTMGSGNYEFSIASKEPKDYKLLVDQTGFISQSQTVSLEGATTVPKTITKTISLVETEKAVVIVPLKLSVQVVDEKTKLPLDANLTLEGPNEAVKTGIANKTNGIFDFSLTSAVSKDYTLTVDKAGYAKKSEKFPIEGAGTSPKTISRTVMLTELKKEPSIVPIKFTVAVVDEKTYNPLEAKVKLEAVDDPARLGTTSKSSGILDFMISSATAREYTVTVECAGYATTVEKFTLEAAGASAKSLSRTVSLKPAQSTQNVPSPSVKLTVYVIDSKTNLPLDANVVLQSAIENKIVEGSQSGPGTYEYYLTSPTTKNYKLSVDKEDYVFQAQQVRVAGATEGIKTMARAITLNAITIGATSVLRNLYFDVGKAVLQPESYPELTAFENMMKKNPTVRVEISGHTDNVGDFNFNKTLSQLRANAVRTFLISKGIAASRMVTVGYGETRPLVSNDDEIGGREINRRVELKILSK